MAEKLHESCHGASSEAGGLTNKEIKTIVKRHQPNFPVGKMPRKALLGHLCHRLCPTLEYTGARDIMVDLDTDGSNYIYKGNVITNSRMDKIKKGAYGQVWRYTFVNEGETMAFAIKTGVRGKKLEEAIVLENHTQSVSCPGVIGMKVRQMQGDVVALMPLADGDLDKYIGLLNNKQANQIVKVVRKAFLCLYENNDYYFDIKPANILFNCDPSGISTIYLGDMGSLIKNDGEYVATFPPPTHAHGYIGDTKDALKIYTYQLSCLYCQLVSGVLPPHWGMVPYMFYPGINALADAAEKKIGHSNKYTVVLKQMANDKNMDRVPDLDKF